VITFSGFFCIVFLMLAVLCYFFEKRKSEYSSAIYADILTAVLIFKIISFFDFNCPKSRQNKISHSSQTISIVETNVRLFIDFSSNFRRHFIDFSSNFRRHFIEFSSTFHRHFIDISSTFHRHFIDISSTFHRHFIDFSSTFHRLFINISSTFHQHFIDISSTFHRHFIDFSSTFHRLFIFTFRSNM
jgi:hypothetical protein